MNPCPFADRHKLVGASLSVRPCAIRRGGTGGRPVPPESFAPARSETLRRRGACTLVCKPAALQRKKPLCYAMSFAQAPTSFAHQEDTGFATGNPFGLDGRTEHSRAHAFTIGRFRPPGRATACSLFHFPGEDTHRAGRSPVRVSKNKGHLTCKTSTYQCIYIVDSLVA